MNPKPWGSDFDQFLMILVEFGVLVAISRKNPRALGFVLYRPNGLRVVAQLNIALSREAERLNPLLAMLH